jgi:subtilisin family serine protease
MGIGVHWHGVNIAVLDQGIDFAHPDLQGSQARVTDPSSPYYGWPIAFDPHAMGYYAATGLTTGGYVDTRTTVTGSTAVFQGRTYTLTGTSKSGVYHMGAHPSYWLRYLVGRWGVAPAVLVVDENTPGVYDTVYVDINKDFDFRNDKPCRRGDEIAWWDVNGDGLADHSAGMLYFIADGHNPIPASDWMHSLPPPANGSLVAFAGAFDKNDHHGTLVASAISARGKSGSTYTVPQKPDESGGMVYGVAPGAGIIQVGSIYQSYADLLDSIAFAVLGYDGIPGTGDEAQIVNMSFSISSEDRSGWDFLSRYLTHLNNTIAPHTTFVASTGNGGPGYGTVTSPGGASSAVSVGAATLYGSTGAFDPIESVDQVLFGDVQQWSNRGPNSLGQIKPEVVAVGAYATGCVPIYGSGENAWVVWGGTSLSAPITSGVLALVYQAYRERYGVFPTHDEAKTILMSGSMDLLYNSYEQGAGMVDAARSTSIASGTGGLVIRPSSWSAGNYRGRQFPAFPAVMRPGESVRQQFTITNTGPDPVMLTFAGRKLQRDQTHSFDVVTSNAAEEPEASMARPDYIFDVSEMVAAQTDLLRVRLSHPYASFSRSDPASRKLEPSSLWLLSLFDWTDLNGDGIVWLDELGSGTVNEGEFQYGELNRFMYALMWGNVLEVSARSPMDRVHDGLFLGLHHVQRNAAIPSTRLKVDVESYRLVRWGWLGTTPRPMTVMPGHTIQVPVLLMVPHWATPGMYTGSFVATDASGKSSVVPISVAVTAEAAFQRPLSRVVGGTDGARDTYDSGRMLGAFDWGWRADSGDWRLYFFDLPSQTTQAKSYLLANARWTDMPSDTDIMIYRPDHTDHFSRSMPEVFGPYGLNRSGSSKRTRSAAGMWPFHTATGGPSEWVAGECGPGLNLVQLHNVLASGKSSSQPIDLRVSRVSTDPGELVLRPGQTRAEVRLSGSSSLPGVGALGFGFAMPQVIRGISIGQEAIADPSSARWRRDITITRAGLIDVEITSPDDIDIDLYLLYDADGDGHFNWTYEVVAVSGTQGASERIRYYLPKPGNYRIAVHGYRVPMPSTFDARMLVVDGNTIGHTVIGKPISPEPSVTVVLTFPPAPPGAEGILFLGPAEAPGVIPVPISVNGTAPEPIPHRPREPIAETRD